MSKKLGGGSWLTAVKRAFRSPSKDDDKKTSRRRLETHEQDIDDEKKREKRRWLFRRASSNSNNIKPQQPIQYQEINIITKNDQQRHAIAVAAATTAAAEAAVATAKAAAEIIRLTKPPLKSPMPPAKLTEHHAAIVVQTAFRGYLARRALQALKGIVKLQAIVRGHNVRKQTKTTLKYLQALRHVQSRAARPSHEATRNSMFAESTNLWDSRYMKDVRARKSTSRGGSWIPEDWEDCPRTLQELDALLQARKNASLTRERSLAHAFSQQMWNYEKEPYSGNDKKAVDEGDNWLNEWMETKIKQCDNNKRRNSYDRRETIKTLEVDSTKKTYCYSSPLISKGFSPSPQAPLTPSPAKMKPLHVRPSSPRGIRSYSTANTPSLAYANNYQIPNYMAATESAKAKVRSQSATRQRPSTPERERGGGVRKRLSYPVVHDMYCVYGVGCEGCGQKLRSPSFKSVQAGYVGMEQRSNISSCCADSVVGGEISPCSTTDLRRWLR